ncbi:AraC-like DNA-binding protein [Parabacteroides sp. PFB2-12]|uniref:AraC family transcriptional regulator n=1 Tax=unclassified Parabacteroides TaxID=2649774 RepID=UPI002475C4CB|nr:MULTISPECIES: AraC family transcriptional regulator [unclassified Parabacteroides]MDH6344103.1 AraC-like DNA-binding protein [Parabacteroides sp. PM6-13]MDH6391550.1 AraC-like DNA-binding protein [Parabacteroides sp. PFB2-12]
MNTSDKHKGLVFLLAIFMTVGVYAAGNLSPKDSLRIDSIAEDAYKTGLTFYKSGVYYQALDNYLLALSLQKELNNPGAIFKIYEDICNAYFYINDYPMMRQYASEAVEYAQETNLIFPEAGFSLHVADASKKTNDSLAAETAYDHAYALFQQIGDTMRMATVLNNKAGLYGIDSPKKLASFREAATLLETPPIDIKKQSTLYHIYTNIGDWYQNQGDYQEANRSFQKAIETVQAINSPRTAIFLYSHLAENYLKQGDYSRAKQLALQTTTLIDKHIGPNHTFDVALKVLGKVYEAEGNYLAAYNALQKWSAVNDSLQKRNRQAEIKKIEQRYEYESYRQEKVNEQNLELERKKASITNLRIILAGLTIACILLVIIGSQIYLYSRKLKAKNRELYLQIKHQDMLTSKVEEKELTILASQPESESSKSTQLYLSLKELMESERLYTQADINRKKIATLLGTNEKYLYDAVKENTDCSFGEYINRLRIRHARRLLTNEESLTIDDIATDSGFGSKATFYRNFREQYKLSPTEYRKLAMEERMQRN